MVVNNNKALKYLFYIAILISISNICYANSNNIGKIDLNKAFILHPKMIFFDYERLGFYKNQIQSNEKRQSGLNNNSLISISDEIQSIKNKIKELNYKLNDISPYFEGKNNEQEIKRLLSEINRLTNKLTDLEFDIANSDITNVEETKEILSLISNEVFKTIEEVAQEQNILVIINDSKLAINNFPDLYENRNVYKKNFQKVKISDNPYYLFLSESFNNQKIGEPPSSVNLYNWLEYARDPSIVRSLPLSNQHFVIYGSKNILLEVLKKIYLKNNCPLDKYQKIESVLKELNY